MPRISFISDLNFLKENTDVVELGCNPLARVLVVPAYQGRVMTSTLAGPEGPSYGWLNRPFIASQSDDPLFNNYGGEDRFWLGPEAGQFALFFSNGQPFDLDHWDSPKGFTTGPFEVTGQDEKSVAMAAKFDVTNYSGTEFQCALKRTIRVLDSDQVTACLGSSAGDGVKMVAFESENTLTNIGDTAWSDEGGMVCIWALGMMKALENGKTVIPLKTGDDAQLGPKANMDYFGQLGPDRGFVGEDHVWFKVDGLHRSKIGVPPARAKDVFGSYDITNNQLTIIQFTLPDNASGLPYPNSAWEIQDNPQGGDPINSYNDPGTEEGLPTFFELESSSPSAKLDTGKSITHVHRTCHFEGHFDALNDLSIKVLGVDLNKLL
ncbi:MAG: hypothetical protein GY794_10070 [bacterium]|nr:hypothetical protein [bacterium]